MQKWIAQLPLTVRKHLGRTCLSVLSADKQRKHQHSRCFTASSNAKCTQPKRKFFTSAIGMDGAVVAFQNNVLDQDDYCRHGMPPARFQLPGGLSIEAILQQHQHIDPLRTAGNELSNIAQDIKQLITSDLPVLNDIATHFFNYNGKYVRPLILCLMSKALAAGAPSEPLTFSTASVTACAVATTESVTVPSVATDMPPNSVERSEEEAGKIEASQRHLMYITEMTRTASLMQDDVLDEAETRRGAPTISAIYSNKHAILGGNFLLARASAELARLRHPDVIELLSQVIDNLVKGEIMQLRPRSPADSGVSIDQYLTKSYFKTASIIANSCKAEALLGAHSPLYQEIAFEYGKNLGLAFQIVDDLLDFTVSSQELGKPALNDLAQGLATAPVLYAAQQYPELRPLIDRKFSHHGDMHHALELVHRSGSLDRARQLALSCVEAAVAAVMQLQPSVYQSALISLSNVVLSRRK